MSMHRDGGVGGHEWVMASWVVPSVRYPSSGSSAFGRDRLWTFTETFVSSASSSSNASKKD